MFALYGLCLPPPAPPPHQVHTGPYDKLNGCYRAPFDWVAAEGYESRMPVLELNENDPRETAPEDPNQGVHPDRAPGNPRGLIGSPDPSATLCSVC